MESENSANSRLEAFEESQIELTTEDLEEDLEELSEKLKFSEVTITRLQDELRVKTDFALELEKQKTTLEHEISRLLTQNKITYENSVIKFATTEKSILDAKIAREAAEKKNIVLQRDIDLLNNKLKASAAEKTRICGILDEKCHELKLSQKEIERLKSEAAGHESKIKWHVSKHVSELRETSEKRIDELMAEINQLKAKELYRVKEEVEIERNMLAEKQMIEQNAMLILLKHDNEEKTRRIEAFEKKCLHLETDLEGLNNRYAELSKENEVKILEVMNASAQIIDSQNLIDKQMLKIAELQSNQNDLEIIRTQLSLEKESNRTLKEQFQSISLQIEEQNVETEKWRKTETELLQLNKEMSESLVQIKNECSMLHSKMTAVALENEMIKKEKSYYENIIHDHQEEIAKRNSDCQLLAKHLSEKTKSVNSLQQKIEEITGDLEAQQKKHAQAVKEMTRELNVLRKKSEDASNVSVAKKSPTTSESSLESRTNDYPSISLEPSQKSLIDRIVRLQNEIVRQSEKIDFLENHQAQLLVELKRLRKK